jgi:hypothetical protein
MRKIVVAAPVKAAVPSFNKEYAVWAAALGLRSKLHPPNNITGECCCTVNPSQHVRCHHMPLLHDKTYGACILVLYVTARGSISSLVAVLPMATGRKDSHSGRAKMHHQTL